MIVSFGDKVTEALYHGKSVKGIRQLPRDVLGIVLRKLDMLNGARSLYELRSPPKNRLEVLHGDLKGYFSIRVNDQWRIVFRWHEGNTYEVRLTDYH